jgi:hypothetical protein
MTGAAAAATNEGREQAGSIRRRHVIYVAGYDPQGAEGYYALFQRACSRFRAVWPLTATVGPLTIDSEDFAHWDFTLQGPNWRVDTRYDFLRQEKFIRADMAEPMFRHIPRVLGWILDDIASGTTWRIFRANWRFGLGLAFFQILVLVWVAIPLVVGTLVARAVAAAFDWPALATVVAALLVAIVLFVALRRIVDRLFVVQITNHWPLVRRFARGEKTWFDHCIEACARRLADAASEDEADELVVIGHSGGGVTAVAVLARALERNPDIGRHGPRLILLTLGSVMPGCALHPAAAPLRDDIRRLAREPSLTWVDCQSRKDFFNFWRFDPVGGIGVELGKDRRNPLIWEVQFRDMVAPDYYRRFRWNLFRLHYQFVMAGDRRAPYDYLMLIGGPVPLTEWATRGHEMVAAFAADGRLVPATAPPSPA